MKSFKLWCAIALVSCAGCTIEHPAPVEKSVAVTNNAFKVEQLFVDPNGTVIYRFYDRGDWRYYAFNPKSGVAQMMPTTKVVEDTTTDTVIVSDGGHGGHGHGGKH